MPVLRLSDSEGLLLEINPVYLVRMNYQSIKFI